MEANDDAAGEKSMLYDASATLGPGVLMPGIVTKCDNYGLKKQLFCRRKIPPNFDFVLCAVIQQCSGLSWKQQCRIFESTCFRVDEDVQDITIQHIHCSVE